MNDVAVFERSASVSPGLPRELSARIQSGPWFADLSDSLRRTILERARMRQVAAGTRIARRGDDAAFWYGVASGAVRLSTSMSDGRNVTLDFVGPSQWFGDIALVDERPLDLDAVAHVATTLLVVSRADLRGLVQQHDELRCALLQLNCQRLRHMLRRFEEQHTLSLAQRLARQIQRLAAQFGRHSGDDDVTIAIGISQGDLAALVGGSRQRVNRAWRQMDQQGIVRLERARLVVCDEARLAAVAEGR